MLYRDVTSMRRRAAALESLAGSIGTVHDELHAARDMLTSLGVQLGVLDRQVEQLAALRREEQHAAARIASLESVLDFDRVSTHVRDAVARADVIEAPVLHAVLAGLFPADVYEAGIDAIPSRIFFDRGAGASDQLRLPPRLAPAHALITWTFLADVMRTVLCPALAERFRRASGEALAARGRIVVRRPGYDGSRAQSQAGDLLTAIVCLARPNDSDDYGTAVCRVGEEDLSRVVPFRANTAVVVAGRTGMHRYASIPERAPADTERYTCELRIGAA
jgi:hypothetical protein